MRSQTSDEEPLEALSVVVDGVAHSPVPAGADDSERIELPQPRDVVHAIRATITEGPALIATPPWSYEPAATGQAARPATLAAGFSRMIPLPGRSLESLADWWARRAQRDRVTIARRLLLEAPQRARGGMWRVRGRLRVAGGTRWLPVELSLWPRFDLWTRLTVEPQRGVRVSRRYFRRGHRVLDTFCEDLERTLGRSLAI